MKLFKKVTTILLSILFFTFFTQFSLAADLNVDCSSSSCSKTGVDPLFSTSADGFWYPDLTVTKTLNLENTGSTTQDFALQAVRTSSANSLEDVLQVSIFPTGGGPVIWSGSMAQFYAQNEIILGSFAPGANLDYTVSVSMNNSAGNEYQNVQTVFDLTAGFWTVPSSGGGGTVLGSGVSSSVCTDVAPGGAPILISAVAGTNSVTLTWTAAANPKTYYLVAYGTSPGNYIYGNPNVGGSNTTSYTINNLSGGTTYYFVVRAGNGCMPGPFSNEISATPGGGFVAGPATGFTEGVLGVSDDEVTPTPSGEVIGEATSEPSDQSTGQPVCWWWLILSILAFIIVSIRYWMWNRRNEKPRFWLVFPVVIGVLAWIGDHFIAHRYFTPSVWCEWMWLWSFLAVGVPTIFYARAKKA